MLHRPPPPAPCAPSAPTRQRKKQKLRFSQKSKRIHHPTHPKTKTNPNPYNPPHPFLLLNSIRPCCDCPGVLQGRGAAGGVPMRGALVPQTGQPQAPRWAQTPFLDVTVRMGLVEHGAETPGGTCRLLSSSRSWGARGLRVLNFAFPSHLPHADVSS